MCINTDCLYCCMAKVGRTTRTSQCIKLLMSPSEPQQNVASRGKNSLKYLKNPSASCNTKFIMEGLGIWTDLFRGGRKKKKSQRLVSQKNMLCIWKHLLTSAELTDTLKPSLLRQTSKPSITEKYMAWTTAHFKPTWMGSLVLIKKYKTHPPKHIKNYEVIQQHKSWEDPMEKRYCGVLEGAEHKLKKQEQWA